MAQAAAASGEVGDAGGIDIDAEGGEASLRHGDRHRQASMPEADDGDAGGAAGEPFLQRVDPGPAGGEGISGVERFAITVGVWHTMI
jgi:hypothetical protein